MLVLVGGLPGSGKTTFAENLSNALNARHLNSDKIRKELGLLGKYDSSSKERVYEALLDESAWLLQQTTLVVDSTFYRKEIREHFQHLAKTRGRRFYFILTVADEEIIRKRVGKKRPLTEADFEVYQKVKGDFEPVYGGYLSLRSDILTLDEMVSYAKRYLLQYG